VVIGLGVLIAGVALTPSIGGSFLTKKRATKIFITKKKATNTFLKKSAIDTAVAVSAPGAAFGSTSATPVPIPGAAASVTVPKGPGALLVAELSGVSTCVAVGDGYSCPIQVFVDGASANPPPESGFYRFDTSNNRSAAHSVSISKSVGPGTHTVTVKYFGQGSGSTNFTLRPWQLLVQSFPR